MFDRITSVVIALSLAILVWLYARSRQLESFDRGYRDQAVTRPEPQAEREIYDVECAVHFLCPDGFPMQPRVNSGAKAMVSLRIEGPIGAGAPKAATYVDLTRRRYDKGQYAEPVHVDLPAGYQIQSDDLPAVAFDLVPIKPDDRSKPADAP
ncbi:MAG: hypothetical protein ACJ8FY_06250 [Gemmataceae bacterium]